jgi:hypothetical protein
MRTAQGIEPHLAETPVQDLAFHHQVLDGPSHVLNGNLRIDPVLVQEIDAIGPQAFQHSLDGLLDVGRSAVEPRTTHAGFKINVPAKLGGDHDLVTERGHAFTEYPFHLMRPISLGRVVEGDATVKGCPNNVDHFGPAGHCRLIGAAHVLDTDTYAGNLK